MYLDVHLNFFGLIFTGMAHIFEDEYPWLEISGPHLRGAFIVIEGLDRAGKTTQVKRLCDALYASGRNVKRLRFPGMPPFEFLSLPC